MGDIYWGGDNSTLDLKVKVISGDEGSSILAQYMKFTRIYKEKTREFGKTREAVLSTLKECKEQDVLKDYIVEHESEVIGIMMSLYDRESYMKLHDKQKKDEGGLEMLIGLVKKGRLTVDEAAEESNMSITEFCKAAGISLAQ